MQVYTDLMQHVLDTGRWRGNRTGNNTIDTFGHHIHIDLKDGYPLVSQRFISTKALKGELIGFLNGVTNHEDFKKLGCSFWEPWALEKDLTETIPRGGDELIIEYAHLKGISTSKAMKLLNNKYGNNLKGLYEKFKSLGIETEETKVLLRKGELGPIYSFAWTSWPTPDMKTINQIANLIRDLKADPDCRREVIVAWNPADKPDSSISPQENVANFKPCLTPCHCLFQFYTQALTIAERIEWAVDNLDITVDGNEAFIVKLGGIDATGMDLEFAASRGRYSEEAMVVMDVMTARGIPAHNLLLNLYQRSADVYHGVPFNIGSYAMLAAMVAEQTNMIPRDFNTYYGSVHLYEKHVNEEMVGKVLANKPFPLAKLKFNRKPDSIFDYRPEDIEIVDYQHHGIISGGKPAV